MDNAPPSIAPLPQLCFAHHAPPAPPGLVHESFRISSQWFLRLDALLGLAAVKTVDRTAGRADRPARLGKLISGDESDLSTGVQAEGRRDTVPFPLLSNCISSSFHSFTPTRSNPAIVDSERRIMADPKPAYHDVTQDRTETHSALAQEHNASLQHGVQLNPDPLLLRSHEHHHAPLHHSTKVGEMEEGDLMYAEEKTLETGGNPARQTTHHRDGHTAGAGMDIKSGEVKVTDTEKGQYSGEDSSDEDPRRHRLSRFYRHFRPAVHAFILALFTG